MASPSPTALECKGTPAAPRPSSTDSSGGDILTVCETTRRLASIQIVCEPEPVEGADFICLARVQGWRVVVNKQHFGFDKLPGLEIPANVAPAVTPAPTSSAVLDSYPSFAKALPLGNAACIFFEPDSVLDRDNPEFAMFDKYHRRVRTQRMKKVISQGLALPLDRLLSYGVDLSTLQLGQDVTTTMKVTKYVAPDEAGQYQEAPDGPGGMSRFPVDAVPKTDEPNLQSNLQLWEDIVRSNRLITVTEKQDGSSMTVSHEALCGRNWQWHASADGEWCQSAQPYVHVDTKYQLREKLKARFERTGEHLWVQCEVVGPKINGNRLGLDALDLKVFNMYIQNQGGYLPHKRVLEICAELQVPSVPIVHLAIPAAELPYKNRNDWIAAANKRTYGKNRPAEGLVLKTDDHASGNGPRLSFKVISPEYLAKIG